jgi:hypothetical protein
MVRKIKTLGLALVAVFAMSAVVTSAASAAAGTLTTFPAGKTVVGTGEQIGEAAVTLTDHPIGTGFASIKCKKLVGDAVGTVTEGATTVTVTPTASECTAFGLPATVEHNECTLVMHSGETTGNGGWQVITTLACPAGKAVTLKTATCEVSITSQELSTAEVANSGSASPETAMDLLVNVNVSNAKYTVVKDGIGCPLTGTGSFSKGDAVGALTVKGLDSVTKAAVGITLHD